jgi:hypothetical protein
MVKYSNPATAVTGKNLNSRTTAELVGIDLMTIVLFTFQY